METQQSLDSWGPAPYPPEPHFDEERTVLSARPVVPLGELKADTRSRRLFLTGAIALAGLLGASAAVLIVYLKQRQIDPTLTINSQPEGSLHIENQLEQANKLTSGVPNETPATLPNDEQITSRKIHARKFVASKSSTANKRSAVALELDPSVSGQVEVAHIVGVIHGDQQTSDREARRSARWEERRLRRETLRNRGVNNGKSDGLFRIREIFEGPRRPQ